MSARQPVGSSWPVESARLHVTGQARFLDEEPEPKGTVHIGLVLSQVAHARLLGLGDRSTATPGVLRVVTAADIPGVNSCGLLTDDEPALVSDTITYWGQPIAAVVGITRRVAWLAARRIEESVRVHRLPARLDPLAAHRAGEYVSEPRVLQRPTGRDIDEALAAAAQQMSGALAIGGQEHFYLETHCCVAEPTEDGGMVVHSSTQNPSDVQRQVARALGVERSRVRVVVTRLGGGFGGKQSQSAQFAVIAAVVARVMGRPAKLRLDREADDLITGKRHPFHIGYRVGFDDSGRIRALDVEAVSNAGHASDLSAPVLVRAMFGVENCYWLPEARIRGFPARTNVQSSTACRGFGTPQGALATEVMLDRIARRVGRDPVDVRLDNLFGTHPPESPADNGVETVFGQTLQQNLLPDIAAELLATSEYRSRRREVDGFNAAGGVLRRGIAMTMAKFGISYEERFLNQAGALVHVYADGSVTVSHSATEMGQGVNIKVLQVVAQELGVRLDQVRVGATDTARVPNTSATAASTGSDLNGMAALRAARRIRGRLAEVAAERFGVPARDVAFADGVVQCGRHRMAFADLVEFAYLKRVQLWSDGFYATPGLDWDPEAMRGHPHFYNCFGAGVSEVVLDTLTGEYRVLRTDLLQDVGRSLNPGVDTGQIAGAFVQGMGWLTGEEVRWDEGGRLQTLVPITYKVPTAVDVPDLRIRLYDKPGDAETIHSSKAVGEPALLLAASVFLAIRDAVVAAGVPDPALDAPATPERVLAVLRAGRSD